MCLVSLFENEMNFNHTFHLLQWYADDHVKMAASVLEITGVRAQKAIEGAGAINQ